MKVIKKLKGRIGLGEFLVLLLLLLILPAVCPNERLNCSLPGPHYI